MPVSLKQGLSPKNVSSKPASRYGLRRLKSYAVTRRRYAGLRAPTKKSRKRFSGKVTLEKLFMFAGEPQEGFFSKREVPFLKKLLRRNYNLGQAPAFRVGHIKPKPFITVAGSVEPRQELGKVNLAAVKALQGIYKKFTATRYLERGAVPVLLYRRQGRWELSSRSKLAEMYDFRIFLSRGSRVVATSTAANGDLIELFHRGRLIPWHTMNIPLPSTEGGRDLRQLASLTYLLKLKHLRGHGDAEMPERIAKLDKLLLSLPGGAEVLQLIDEEFKNFTDSRSLILAKYSLGERIPFNAVKDSRQNLELAGRVQASVARSYRDTFLDHWWKTALKKGGYIKKPSNLSSNLGIAIKSLVKSGLASKPGVSRSGGTPVSGGSIQRLLQQLRMRKPKGRAIAKTKSPGVTMLSGKRVLRAPTSGNKGGVKIKPIPLQRLKVISSAQPSIRA